MPLDPAELAAVGLGLAFVTNAVASTVVSFTSGAPSFSWPEVSLAFAWGRDWTAAAVVEFALEATLSP